MSDSGGQRFDFDSEDVCKYYRLHCVPCVLSQCSVENGGAIMEGGGASNWLQHGRDVISMATCTAWSMYILWNKLFQSENLVFWCNTPAWR